MDVCHIYKLPNELLLNILAPVPTPELLPLTTVSHRIYTLILRILQNRLVAASKLHSHSLLLECYHPSAKLTEPASFCTYLGTHGLSDPPSSKSPESSSPSSSSETTEDDTKSEISRLGEMRNLYSHFRPYRRDLDSTGRRVLRQRRHPAGDVPGSRTFPMPGTAEERYEGERVKQVLGLDGEELFTQLVAQANLVKISEVNGLFSCFVEVEEGVVRVWREWLRDMEKGRREKEKEKEKGKEEAEWDMDRKGKGKVEVHEVEGDGRDSNEKLNLSDDNILWVSPGKNTGLKFNVRERRLRRDVPILVRADEADMPVSYEIEYDELLIRTSHLLLMLEKSMVQEDNTSGKAVVFGSFG